MKQRTSTRWASLLMIGAIVGLAGQSYRPVSSETRRYDPSEYLNTTSRERLPSELYLPNGGVDVLIELKDQAVVEAWSTARQISTAGAATQLAREQGRRIERAQQLLLPKIAASGGQVLYQVQRTINGIVARVPVAQLDDIRALDGVRGILPMLPKRIDNSSGVPLIGGPELWKAALSNVRGESIRVGVIDTGIDYLHTSLGGSGLAADYERNNTTLIGDLTSFPGLKVVGGFDFAGDMYDAASPDFSRIFPRPDPDPMDCNGHGTHVAATAAGYGVNGDGSTYTGPWSTGSVPFETMRIGPGVAPLAQLYALRIFGCEGTTNLVIWALDWASDPDQDYDFSDHLDVVNLSLGSIFGGSDQDPDVRAANQAALAGVIVVASAGNSADITQIHGSPAAADWAISVASSVDSAAVAGIFRINTPDPIAGTYPANEAKFGPNLGETGPFSGTVAYPDNDQSKGCTEFNATNASRIKDKIALIDRGDCSMKLKIQNAQRAGAIGALIVNNSPDYPTAIPEDKAITTTITIPAMLIMQSTGNLIKTHLDDPGGVQVTLTAEQRGTRYLDNNRVDALSTFTSRGPQRASFALKPDVAAPGDTIFSAANGTGSQGVSFSGTSMAAPHVAGAMALLRQIHPDWTVQELKALLINTANAQTRVDGPTGTMYLPIRQGAGRIMLQPASTAGAVAYNADNPGQVSISFGAPQVVDTTTLVKNIRVVNKSSNLISYTIGIVTAKAVPGVTVTPLTSTITLGPYRSTTIGVQMRLDAALLNRIPDPTLELQQMGQPRHFLNEHAGYITLTGPDTLKVPFYVAPRPATAMQAVGPLSLGIDETTTTLRLRGNDINTSAYHSRGWVLELHEHNINDTNTNGVAESGDLKYLGLGTDLPPGAPLTDQTMIYFGVASFGAWSTPQPYDTQFYILIDRDQDNVPEFELINWNLSQAQGNSGANDVFVSALFDITSRKLLGTWPINRHPATTDTAVFQSSVMVLPVSAGALGLTNQHSRFNYQLFVFQRESGLSDLAEIHTFDPRAPAVSIGGPPDFDDLNGNTVPIRINSQSWERDNVQGLLVLHHFNQVGAQAEVVPVRLWFKRFMPIVSR